MRGVMRWDACHDEIFRWWSTLLSDFAYLWKAITETEVKKDYESPGSKPFALME